MNAQCSTELLELALAGNLPTDDEISLYRHLEICDECSAALEQMAGGAAWCQEAAALLAEDELDLAVPTSKEWSEVDFTVEHLEPSDEPNVLGRLGGYDVLEIIGCGGMGLVLKAYDRELKRCVAIKVLAPHLAHSSLARKRFAREAQAAAAVVHPHVLAIHQVQPGGRLPFFVMPLVAGESLAQRLAVQGTLELKEILRIGMQAAAGLAAAHEQGLVHRDVKPANILLEKGVERAVLTDFGLARAADDVTLTRCGIIAGTPQYMSPEQVRGEPLDGRSDLFSLGCVLYEIAAGVSPFRADSLIATMRRLVDDSPQALASLSPELPPWFIGVVNRLLEKDPSRRFSSAKEVSELLEGCLAHVQQPANVPLPARLPKPAGCRVWWPSHIGLKRMLAMITASIIGLTGILLVSAEPSEIAGEWCGEEWGQVVLNKTNDMEYAGTYTDTFGKQPGKIQLKWSRIERRFNGTWREGEDRFGKISIRLVGQEIRGAHTTDPKSRINPATPRLADLAWHKVQVSGFGPVIEREVEENAGPRFVWFDLDHGKSVASTNAFPDREDKDIEDDEFQQWRIKNGVDVGASFSGGHPARLLSLDSDFACVAVNEDQWQQMATSTLQEILRAAHQKVMTHDEKRPATYVFKTREGGNGILQITGVADKPRGVKIRYKLVQGGDVKAAAVVMPATANAKPTFGPVVERVLPSGVDCRQQYFQFRSGEIFIVGNGPGTTEEEAALDEQRIEDAGGVDISANRSEDRIFINGRGCIFTRDIDELNWDRITAEQVILAMKRARRVESEVTPMKTDLPFSYLFKTSRGEVGVMQVLGSVEVKHEGWTENGMKFRYKLVQGTGTTTTAAPPLVFGAGAQGLQAALEVTPGEPFKLRIHIRNVSDRGIAIDGAYYRQEDECLLSDVQGQPVPITKVTHDIKMGMKGGYFGPGQVAVFECAGLSFQDIDKVPASAGYVAKAKPGRYTLRLRIRLPGEDVPFAAGAQAWKGELETGPVTIEVKDVSTLLVAPVADSVYSAILGPAVECVVNDLQTTHENCALSFDSGKLLPVPANITLDMLTNASVQPAALAWARDNQVDAIGFVTSDGDKILKFGLLCPGLLVLRANNKEWNPDQATSLDLKEAFQEAMHESKEIPSIVEIAIDEQFPGTCMILDTRTHRRGVLQIKGVADNPRGVKIRYRLVEGAPVKSISSPTQPIVPK